MRFCFYRYAIVYLTVDGDTFKIWIQNQLNVNDISFIDLAAISVSIINATNNQVCKILVKLCQFDNNGSEVKTLVALLFISRTFNVAIQLSAYAQLLNVFMFLRIDFKTNQVMHYFGISGLIYRKTAKLYDSDTFSCRANQFGNQFFGLLVTEFAMGKLLGVVLPSVKYLISKLRGKKFTKSR